MRTTPRRRRRGVALAVAASGSGKPTREQLTRVLSLATRSARSAGVRAVTSGKWLADISLDATSHLPVRDEVTLVEHFGGLQGPDLAAALVRNASLTSGAVGGVTGALAAASQLHPAAWTAMPFELLGETLVVVAIEMKLVAELHEVAHQGVRGTLTERGTAIATAWSESRGLQTSDLLSRPLRTTAADLVGRQTRSALASSLRKRILLRAGRNLTSFAPLMAGAAAGVVLNRRATRSLGRKGHSRWDHTSGDRAGPVEPPAKREFRRHGPRTSTASWHRATSDGTSSAVPTGCPHALDHGATSLVAPTPWLMRSTAPVTGRCAIMRRYTVRCDTPSDVTTAVPPEAVRARDQRQQRAYLSCTTRRSSRGAGTPTGGGGLYGLDTAGLRGDRVPPRPRRSK